jgi:hypothetical protein
MISRNINRDDRPRIPPLSNDTIRGNPSNFGGAGKEFGIEVLREFESEFEDIFDPSEQILENLSVRDRAAGRQDESKLNISDIKASSWAGSVSVERSIEVGN